MSLVLADRGEPIGVLPDFEVATPWWQDVAPFESRIAGIAVLRLLDVRAAPGATSGGHVTYLTESLAHGSTFGADHELEPWEGELVEDPLRMPWAVPGGPAGDLAWAIEQLGGEGRCRQHRTWNLSSIWSLGPGGSEAWLKCVPSFFAHEATILRALAGQPVPSLVAADGHRMLLGALPGVDGYDATFEQYVALLDVLVDIQRETIARVDELVALGVPDRRPEPLLASIDDVVSRRAPRSGVLRGFVETAPERFARIAECGLPDVLVHGDAHPGNARIEVARSPGIWFDWGDATVGHPLLDLGVLDRLGMARGAELRAHWLEAWRRAVPGSDPRRAFELLRPLAPLVGAVVYQGFLDRIERSERVYHEADVPRCLRDAEALLAATR